MLYNIYTTDTALHPKIAAQYLSLPCVGEMLSAA